MKNIKKYINILFWILVVVYVMTFTLVGRFLAYNDLYPRAKVDPSPLSGYNYRDIQFRSSNGVVLKGWFINSARNDNGKTLFLLHGWLSNRDTIVQQAKMFVDSGFHVIMYDQRAHGESNTGLVTYGDLEGEDLLSAVEYSKSIPEINQRKLGAVAFSLGTGSIIYAQVYSGDTIFKAAILEGAFATSFDVGDKILVDRFGYFGGKFVGYGIFTVGTKMWSLGKFQHSETAEEVAQIRNLPILVIRGENDELVPMQSFMRFQDSIHSAHEIWCNSEGCHTHAFQVYGKEYGQRTTSFLKEYLEY